jgi:HEAT repeat protein
VTEAPAEGDATVTDLMNGSPAMRVRYLVLDPLGELARAGDGPAVARIADAILHDPDAVVGARVAAVGDVEPRVREAALTALDQVAPPNAVGTAAEMLEHDGWPFVRVRAAGVLMNAPASKVADDALGHALRDSSARIRGAAALGLGLRRATTWRSALRDRLRDADEDAEVRAAAASALGGVCDGESAGLLAGLAATLADPGLEDDAQQIGFGALVGLATLKPPDEKSRLAPLLRTGAPPRVRAAAEMALAARGACKW